MNKKDFPLKRTFRSSCPAKVFLGKSVLKICSKFTGEHPCRSVISIKIKLQSNFIEITRRYGCSAVNLLYIFRTLFWRTPRDGCFWTFSIYNNIKANQNFVPKSGQEIVISKNLVITKIITSKVFSKFLVLNLF